MDAWEGLLEPATERRLRRARAGEDVAVRLELGRLRPGQVGIVEATVVQVFPSRAFQRRDGRTGTVGRVLLRDATGEAPLVLWDDDAGLASGPLAGRSHVRIEGAVVQEGFRGGGPELALAGPVVPLASGDVQVLEGTLRLAPTEPVQDGDRMRFRAEGALDTADGVFQVVLWDDAVRQAQDAAARVRLTDMAPHPVLESHWVSTKATRVLPQA